MEVLVNGASVGKRHFGPDDAFGLPWKSQIPAAQAGSGGQVTIRKSGNGITYWSAESAWYSADKRLYPERQAGAEHRPRLLPVQKRQDKPTDPITYDLAPLWARCISATSSRCARGERQRLEVPAGRGSDSRRNRVPAQTGALHHQQKPVWWADYFTRKEFHDDRAAFFNTDFSGRREYVYLLKVDNEGKFAISPRIGRSHVSTGHADYNRSGLAGGAAMRVFEVWGDLIRDGIARLGRAWGWFVAQFFGLALLIALGLLWTRVPEKYGWQVALTLVLPAVILLGFLVLQAGTLRAWLRPEPIATTDNLDEDDEREPRRVWLMWGALTLVTWIALGWAAWIGLDRVDSHTFQWAAYLNSKFGPHARATWASFDHLNRDLEWALWTVRSIVVPGLLIPLGCCSAAWGLLRMPWRRGLHVWGKWNWWPVVAIWALIAVAWPQTWFAGLPHGTVHAQIWHVLLKIAAAYLLAVTGWNKVLAWSAMLVDPRPQDAAG